MSLSAEALRGRAVEFDLTEDSVNARNNPQAKLGVGAVVAVYVGTGILTMLVGVLGFIGAGIGYPGGVGAGIIIAGIAIIVLGSIAMLRLSHGVPVRLRVDDTAVTLIRGNGTALTIAWADPLLKIDVSHLIADPREVLPKGEPRSIHPFWIDVWRPPSRWIQLETTVPREAAEAIIVEARLHPLRIASTQVAFYWSIPGRGGGYLLSEKEGSLHEDRTVNGEITTLRGLGWPAESDP